MIERIFHVLEITIPVFGMIGLGYYLTAKNIMSADHRQFINKIIFYFSLPALIFVGVAGTPFDKLVNIPVITCAVIPTVVTIILSFICMKLFPINTDMRAPFIYSSFWANATYMGFPLAKLAFGDEGFTYAVILNAFGVPLWIIAGTTIANIFGSSSDSFAAQVKKAFISPIVAAAFFGVIAAYIIQTTSVSSYAFFIAPASIIVSFLKLGGSMGLPLALIAIGGGLSFKAISDNKLALTSACLSKLCITPLITLLTIKYLFPSADNVVVGSCVLMMGTPVAVASYVIATKSHIKEEAASTVVIWSTAASIITIPVWLYVLI